MQTHGAMHEPITSHTSNGVSITREQLLYSTPAVAGRVTEVISGIKTNYHSCKGLRKRGHRFKTHGTVHGAGSGKNQYYAFRRHRQPHWYSSGCRFLQGVLHHPCTRTCKSRTPRIFHSRRTTARLTQFTVAGVINAASSNTHTTRRLQPPAIHQKITAMLHGS